MYNFLLDAYKTVCMVPTMPTKACAVGRVQTIAARLGVHPNSVWGWRRTGKLPKNRLIRSEYLKLDRRQRRQRRAS